MTQHLLQVHTTLSTIYSLSHAQGALTSAGTWKNTVERGRAGTAVADTCTEGCCAGPRPNLAKGICNNCHCCLLGYDVCAPALQRIRINLFAFHFPRHRSILKIRSCHPRTHRTFESTKVVLLQSKTGVGLGHLLKTSQASTYQLQKQSPNLSWLQGSQMTARTKLCPRSFWLHLLRTPSPCTKYQPEP